MAKTSYQTSVFWVLAVLLIGSYVLGIRTSEALESSHQIDWPIEELWTDGYMHGNARVVSFFFLRFWDVRDCEV